MFVDKLSVMNDEKVVRKSSAGMHYSDRMGAPKISEGYLILTNKKLIFAGRGALDDAATQIFKLVLGATTNLSGGESPFVERFKGAILFPFERIVEVGKGGRTIRSIGMQTLKVNYEGTGEFRFQIPVISGKVDDWIKIIKSTMKASTIHEEQTDLESINLADLLPRLPYDKWVDIRELVGYKSGVKKTLYLKRHENGVDVKEEAVNCIESSSSKLKNCWLQGINGSFEIIKQGTTNLENAIKGVEQLTNTPLLQNSTLCPFTLGFSNDTSSIEMYKVSENKFFFRATYGERELMGDLKIADVKDCITDYFDNRELRCKNLLKES